jgi:tetratricopeptide (TPR) repeat protein
LLRRAPNEPSVHSAAAYVYRVSGQYERALEEWDRLLKISPTDVVFASYNRARIYIYQRDYARAEAEIARGLAFESHHPMLRAYSAVIDYYKGEIEKATLILEDVLEKNPDLHSQKIFLAYCYLARGERERALALIDDQVIATARADQDIAYRLSTVYALDKQADEALEWLERSISMGNENYPWMAANPNWEALRDDARYRAVMDSLKERWERLSEPAGEQ